jgi:hypothetical protein
LRHRKEGRNDELRLKEVKTMGRVGIGLSEELSARNRRWKNEDQGLTRQKKDGLDVEE